MQKAYYVGDITAPPVRQGGYTLIEMIIVIVIIAIVSVALILAWPETTLNLDGQAYLLANDIRYAQAMAIQTNTRYQLVRLSPTSYQISSFNSSPTVTKTAVTLTSGMLFTSFPNNLIAFDGSGKPYSNNSIPGTALSIPMTIVLAYKGATKSITISPNTGYVNV
jgi:prepilin-type N-terminal cleavage/methylation domain-containing protein